MNRKFYTAVAIFALTAVAAFGQTNNVSTNTVTSITTNTPPTSVTNVVSTTGIISQATGDIVGGVLTWIANNGAAGVGENFPMSKRVTNPGSGPTATVFARAYEFAWTSNGTTNMDTRIGLVNDTVFGHNFTGNQTGVGLTESVNTDGIANATKNIPVIGFLTKAAASAQLDFTVAYTLPTDGLANGHIDGRDDGVTVGIDFIKMYN